MKKILFSSVMTVMAIMALSPIGSAHAVIFNYSTSSPTSPLLPTVNNGCTQMSFDPISSVGFSTPCDVAVANLRLNSAIIGVTDDIWFSVPFLIDLVIQDNETGQRGLFQIEGIISGVTKIGKSLLGAGSIDVFPSSRLIGGKVYTVALTPYSLSAPGAPTIPGIDGVNRGTISVRVSAARVSKIRVTSVMDNAITQR